MVETTDIGELKTLIQTLLGRISQLEAQVVELQAENTTLRSENTELRRRLGLNSTNSHKPPATDGYAKKPALPKPEGGKVGGQKGHPGKTLLMVEVPDWVVTHQATECPDCGQALTQGGQVVARRQVFDLPKPGLEVTEHQLLQHHCPCGCVVRGAFPASVGGVVQYGTRINALSSLFNIEYRLPFAKISQLWLDLTGYAYNESTAVSANRRLYEELAPVEAHIKTQLGAAPVTHHDETGLRVEGKLHWLHVTCTALLTYLFIHPKRGRKALESAQSVFLDCVGWTVHDCWASYFVAGKGRHSLCGAHLLRELQALVDGGSAWAVLMHAYLLDLYKTTRQGSLPVEQQANWLARYTHICQVGFTQEPPPLSRGRGRPRQSKGRNLLNRLVEHQNAVLAFGFEVGVPFTNNQAERDLRPAKVKQKVSNCFRTEVGGSHYARISGFISTMRKNKLNVLEQLTSVLSGSFTWAT
jgi:transposase